jgi:AcrR family transcriptional regulator
LRKRAQASEETRRRIVAAACALLEHAGYHQISLDDLAQAAEVSRQTIYVQFGSKSGVLQAVAEYIEHAGLENLIAELLASPTPLAAFQHTCQRLVAFFGQYAAVLRNLQAQTIYDVEFAVFLRSKQNEIWHNTRRMIEWLATKEGHPSGWSIDEATDWLWMLTSFEMYDKLVTERGWSAEQYIGRIMDTLEQILGMPKTEPR